ncbi:MAG TPA: 3-oxoacyl-ACP synthase III family protein [Anaeromyxobacteraceae bacterium]|nr:3-oxoacyl-ACP synthase III family protein [Anaeromyxobacteraceae bacterium]
MKSVRVVGGGAFLPKRVVKNDKVAKAIPGWSAERIFSRTGIEERRFLWEIDAETGRGVPPPEDATYWPRCNVDMGEAALRRALEVAGLAPTELDAIYLVTTTPDQINFCHDAVQLHRRLGCRRDAHAVVVDSGCGGALYVVDMVRRMILSGTARTIAVVATTFASAFLDREVFTCAMPENKRINGYLTMYMFGDGAGAMILRGDEQPDVGILASTAGTDHQELVVHRGGGAALPPHTRASLADHAFYINGPVVAEAYPFFMQKAVDEMRAAKPELVPQVKRYYLHQANRHVLAKFVEQAGLPADKVAVNVNRYGNTSAASTLILFAEDLEQGVVKLGSDELVLFAAVGAGVHYGGQLVRL